MAHPSHERTEVIVNDEEHRDAHHDYVAEPAVASERVDTIVADPYAERHVIAHKLSQFIYLLFGIFEVLIAFRLLFRLLGANPASPFVAMIYGATAPLVAPFAAIFPRFQSGGFVFEPEAVVAMLVYILLAWLLVRLVHLALDHGDSATATTSRRYRTRA